MGSGTTCGNAKQRLQLRQRGRGAEPLMSLIRQMQTRPSYRASGHPATKAVMQCHMETINRLKSAGKALQQDVDNLITLFDVYNTLPLRPNGTQEGENRDAVDPKKPLGQPLGKRFVRADYAVYIVGFDH